jgi:hypothetical protein
MAALWLADAYAAHILSLRQRERMITGKPKTADDPKDPVADTDLILGWLLHCLRDKNLLIKDNLEPRIWFDNYRRTYAKSTPTDAAIQGRERNFDLGWSMGGGNRLPRSIALD